MTIAFIHPLKSFLPEINAYADFFNKYGIRTEIHPTEMYDSINAEVEWYFMGMKGGKKKKNTIIIHEYASASISPFRKEKDFLKRIYNQQPDYRLFLNLYVKQRLGFKDNIPFGLRDMGVADLFFVSNKNIEKEYDFIYTGSVAPERQIEKLLDRFTRKDLQMHSLLIVSKDYHRIARHFAPFSNIHFEGPVTHEVVAGHIAKARFCINYMPDKEPFNQQTPVKLLEYLSLQIPVISSRYSWAEQFQRRYGGEFFFLEKDLSNFTWENITRHNYSFPDMHAWKWEKQIRESGILEFLQSKFRALQF
jgi:glycosyltransferase involved in cell wall biosynthesis